MDEAELLPRITVTSRILGGKPISRGRRLAVEHVLGMLVAGDSSATILAGYAWLEAEDIRACLAYARRLVAHERVEAGRRRERAVKVLLDTCAWAISPPQFLSIDNRSRSARSWGIAYDHPYRERGGVKVSAG